MHAQVCERERLDFQKTTTKKNLYPLEFFLSPHHINSCLFFFFLHQTNRLLNYHRNTVFYSEIHLNKLLKDLYFLKSHTLSGFVSILCVSISD